MEHAFQFDFSHVRVHSGPRSAAISEAVGAIAFTIGSNIVFGRNQFRPDEGAGRQLLAHELAHVIQQSRGGTAVGSAASLEGEASRSAELATSGARVAVNQSAAPGIQRQVIGWNNDSLRRAASEFVIQLGNLLPEDKASQKGPGAFTPKLPIGIWERPLHAASQPKAGSGSNPRPSALPPFFWLRPEFSPQMPQYSMQKTLWTADLATETGEEMATSPDQPPNYFEPSKNASSRWNVAMGVGQALFAELGPKAPKLLGNLWENWNESRRDREKSGKPEEALTEPSALDKFIGHASDELASHAYPTSGGAALKFHFRDLGSK